MTFNPTHPDGYEVNVASLSDFEKRIYGFASDICALCERDDVDTKKRRTELLETATALEAVQAVARFFENPCHFLIQSEHFSATSQKRLALEMLHVAQEILSREEDGSVRAVLAQEIPVWAILDYGDTPLPKEAGFHQLARIVAAQTLQARRSMSSTDFSLFRDHAEKGHLGTAEEAQSLQRAILASSLEGVSPRLPAPSVARGLLVFVSPSVPGSPSAHL